MQRCRAVRRGDRVRHARVGGEGGLELLDESALRGYPAGVDALGQVGLLAACETRLEDWDQASDRFQASYRISGERDFAERLTIAM